jgi:hypothetical protein
MDDSPVKKAIVRKAKGAQATLDHLQGFIRLKKKIFNWQVRRMWTNPLHREAAKGSNEYNSKDGSKEGHILVAKDLDNERQKRANKIEETSFKI